MIGIRTYRESRRRASRYRSLATLLDGGIAMLAALEQLGIRVPADAGPGDGAASGPGRARFDLGRLLAPGEDAPALVAERAAIDAAHHAGELPPTLRALAEELEGSLAARRTAIALLAYPLLLLHLLPVATTLSELLTKPARFFGQLVVAYAVLWGTLAAAVAAYAALQRSEAGVATLSRWPLLGRPTVLQARARFFRLLALLEGAGVLRHEALATATAALGPAVASDGYADFGLRTRRGDPPEQVAAALTRLPLEERGELAASITVGALEAAARRIADRASEQWRAAMMRLAKLAGGFAYGSAIVLVMASVLRFYMGYFASFKPPR